MSALFQLTQQIKAPAPEVMRAFTNAQALREWLCDTATVDPRPGGRLYLYWNGGYYACGEYSHVIPEKEIVFTWRGRSDPSPSRVQINLDPREDGIHLTLQHFDLGDGSAWEKPRQEIEKGWTSGLENLVSYLETGADLRVVRRPMLGLVFSDFNAQIAAELGMPITEGLRIDSTVEGMGARLAGLQNNDVIVAMGGKPTPHFPDVESCLVGCHAGDTIEVEFYRGSQKMNTRVTLSSRPIPLLPSDPKELAQVFRAPRQNFEASLSELLAGVSEEAASFKPSPGDWNVKEVLAHLIHGERAFQQYLQELICGQESWSDGYAENIDCRIQATISAYGSLANLLEELKRADEETAVLVSLFPAEFIAHKGTYWRLYFLMQPPFHHLDHLLQIKALLQTAAHQAPM